MLTRRAAEVGPWSLRYRCVAATEAVPRRCGVSDVRRGQDEEVPPPGAINRPAAAEAFLLSWFFLFIGTIVPSLLPEFLLSSRNANSGAKRVKLAFLDRVCGSFVVGSEYLGRLALALLDLLRRRRSC